MMRCVIVPARAGILCPNKLVVAELQSGDIVSGYDNYGRRVVNARIVSLEKLANQPRVSVPISRFQTLTLVADTVALTPTGEKALRQGIRQFMGYCYKSPKNLLIRDVDTIIESKEEIKVVKLAWEGADYIWTDGILIGTKG